jgi:CubicO group peptidase (beta-lactamase class C family)
MRRAVIFLSLALAGFPATAQDITNSRMQERFNVGGYIKVGRNTPHTFKPHQNPRGLPRARGDDPGNRHAAAAAADYMRQAEFATGMMLIDHGKIVFENYKGKGNEASEFYSMSIAKSLTSLAVGKALCNGLFGSLDTLAGDIVPETKVNGLGQSTLRQLLMMSSGVWLTTNAGQPTFTGGFGHNRRTGKAYPAAGWPIRLGQITVADYLWGQGWEKAENKNHAEPGQVFVYKAADTMTLSKVLEKAAAMSLAAYFDKHVWQSVRGEKTAHWEADRDGTTLAHSGFQASLRDWGRIAIWVLEQVKKPGCFGNYLRQATTTQIRNARLGSGSGGTFDGYGYQWWTENSKAPGFWGKGYAGQELAINPETEKILVKFSYVSDCSRAGACHPKKRAYQIFREWNRPS